MVCRIQMEIKIINKNMINILLAGPDIQRISGGVQRHIRNLLDIFENVEDFKLHHFQIANPHYNHGWAKKAFLGISNIWCLITILATKKIDIVHINASVDLKSFLRDSSLAFFSKIFRKKVILQIHGGYLSRINGRQLIIVKSLAKILFKISDVVLFLTKLQYDELNEFLEDKKVYFVSNYVNHNSNGTQYVDDSSIRNFTILFCSRIEKEKGVYEILQVFESLLKEKGNYYLKFIGGGSEVEKLKTLVEEKNLKNIKFYGILDGADKFKHFESADVFLLPSYAEAFPYSILEAMQYGCAIVASPVGALPDIIKDEKNGYLIPSSNIEEMAAKISLLHANKKLLNKMKINNMEKISDFYSFQNGLKIFKEVYEYAFHDINTTTNKS
ncbi:MAG: glycosyltransferase [Candidatus Lokiarchaeota archaeon]|nr:glycosyltransferase [Candidatus Lokiarchaeota archaeon]